MALDHMKNESFKPQSIEDWKLKAEDTLKGKSIDALSRNTYENIKLKPLYTNEDLHQDVSQYPGEGDFRRGMDSLGYVERDWNISQKMTETDPQILREKLLQAFKTGQTAIAFNIDAMAATGLVQIVEGLHEQYPFSIVTEKSLKPIFDQLQTLNKSEEIEGYIAMDPLAVTAKTGASIDTSYSGWAEAVSSADKHLPKLQTVIVDSSVYHNGGANAVQELAVSVAVGVNHIERLLNQGMSIEKIVQKIVFKYATGANFFMEIAKLRAARLLWNKVTEAYGVAVVDRRMVIAVETSSFTQTAYDPYVNMLRSGNEAFAAVLGGIQYLHVAPYNAPEGASSNFSDRIARNTQLILREEAHLKKVIDPAGGSWYIEHLTKELAEQAWAFFLQIDERDGMEAVLKSGWIQEQVAAIRSKRQEDTFVRKQSMIGTNIYANLQDKPLTERQNDLNLRNTEIQIIPQSRLSEPFEHLRRKAEGLKGTGIQPEAGLICLGPLKAHKARMDFITGFLAPGGIEPVKSTEIDDTEAALDFVKQSSLKHYFICGSNDQYDETVVDLVQSVKTNNPSVQFYLAGLPAKDEQNQWEQAGVKGFIHMRSNCYETLLSILNDLEDENNE
ncbi:methylmalonyl-CoA mutase subunit beta [Cytobacillus purgationiresistens]|uniref:methylmalonyl-CoA mutase n=1 Tax=Cytobacillus purgationiresistens TaxID=863449 RepID=A0ABU0ADP7_9BACI|nr:methylmalonyl-CoA mutase subunit beta [Cytobacillus purgationiresistens]MDQ0269371.1 methylmalonyl-CoA mutase [Cytobacillus purgationiresistens]